MSNEKSYNKITISIATALMIVATIAVGFQLAQPVTAQNVTEQLDQAAENMTEGGNQTGNETGGPLDFLGDIFGGN